MQAIARDKALTFWEDVADFFECWAACQDEPTAQDLQRLMSALSSWGDDEIEMPYFKSIVAETLTRSGAMNDGLRLIEDAEKLMHHTGECWYRPYLERSQIVLSHRHGGRSGQARVRQKPA